jgi:hypothetical protein
MWKCSRIGSIREQIIVEMFKTDLVGAPEDVDRIRLVDRGRQFVEHLHDRIELAHEPAAR